MKSEKNNGVPGARRGGTSMIDSILDAVSTPVIVIDADDAITRSNLAACSLFGYSKDDLTGTPLSRIICGPQTSKTERFAQSLEAIGANDEADSRFQARHRDGSTLYVHLALIEIETEGRSSFIATIRDQTEQRRQEIELMHYIQDLESARAQSETQSNRVVDLVEELAADKERLKTQEGQLRENEKELHRYIQDLEMTRSQFEKQAGEMAELAEDLHSEKERVEESRRVIEHQALHDPLTQLGNRALLGKVLPPMLEQAAANGTKVGLIYIDLDNFKPVNDLLGHDAGDDLLCTVAEALRECVREDDEVVRQGGDEFAIAVRLNASRTEADLADLADRIREALAIAVDGPDFKIETGASVGVALFPEDGQDIDTMLVAADAAMYRVKRARAGGSQRS